MLGLVVCISVLFYKIVVSSRNFCCKFICSVGFFLIIPFLLTRALYIWHVIHL